MARRTHATRILLAVSLSAGMIAVTGSVAVASAAQAATSNTGSAGSAAVTAAGTDASASAPCVVSVSAPRCQSPDPDLTVDVGNTGDTSGCTFTFSINWDDGSAAQQVTVAGQPQSGEYLLADHMYHAAQTHTYSVTATSVSVTGNCTSGPGSYTFTLEVGSSPTSLWGFDTSGIRTTAQATSYLNTVTTQLGTPQVTGQYLEYWKPSHEVLTAGIVTALHTSSVRILLVSSPKPPPGQRPGMLTAVSRATRDADVALAGTSALNVPRGVAIFRDVEQGWQISAPYIETWDALIAAAGYVPGFYENPLGSGRLDFSTAYCAASAAVPSVAVDTLLFSSQPQNTESALSASQPAWDPDEPACSNTTIAWQYYIDYGLSRGKTIDLDEVLPQYTRYLW
jgi:Domain of unknown function (DUF1906)